MKGRETFRRPATPLDSPHGTIHRFLLIAAGVGLIILGLLAWSGALSWFGRLPGDLRIERPNVRVYIPITSMIILSVVLSLILAVLRRWR